MPLLRFAPRRSPFATVGGIALGQLLVALATLVALAVASRWGSAAVDMLFLPAVLAAAIWGGVWPALLAAVSAALAYNYFFTAPYHTLRITSAADVVDVVVLFLVALVASQLAAAIRNEAARAEAHAARNATIAGFARRLLGASSENEIADAACAEASTIFGCNAALYRGAPQPVRLSVCPAEAASTPADLAAVLHTLRSGEAAGRDTPRLNPADWTFFPVGDGREPVAALGLARDDGAPPVGDDQRLLLDSLLDQVALALSRVRGSAPAPLGQAA
ncbi:MULTISPECIES: DUF4118 domain-containing protein [Sphingomonas]|uniref:DUF4118 domain-containing protein n=1 Tax=Sphingomonas TaxID=13687 RepID=UPI0013B41768|nr:MULTISPECIES: DUF4118 domain-containing protein [Sphingomonas]